jgi:hypothetical protein
MACVHEWNSFMNNKLGDHGCTLFMNDELSEMTYFIFIINYTISTYMCLMKIYIEICYMMSFMKLIHHYNCDFWWATTPLLL